MPETKLSIRLHKKTCLLSELPLLAKKIHYRGLHTFQPFPLNAEQRGHLLREKLNDCCCVLPVSPERHGIRSKLWFDKLLQPLLSSIHLEPAFSSMRLLPRRIHDDRIVLSLRNRVWNNCSPHMLHYWTQHLYYITSFWLANVNLKWFSRGEKTSIKCCPFCCLLLTNTVAKEDRNYPDATVNQVRINLRSKEWLECRYRVQWKDYHHWCSWGGDHFYSLELCFQAYNIVNWSLGQYKTLQC